MKKKINDRRAFMKNAMKLAMGTSLLTSASLQASTNQEKKKPNILVIYSDQQALWTISAYAGKTHIPIEIDTPNIDRIAKEGVLLNNYFTNSALCTPSRGCFVSGLYPHRNGAYENDTPLDENALADGTWGSLFYDEGYETGWIGKWHLDGRAKPGLSKPDRFLGFGQQQWRWNRGHWKGVRSKGKGMHTKIKKLTKKILSDGHYTTNWLGNRTIDFLKRQHKKGNKTPFAFVVSFPDPHGPHTIYKKYADEYTDKVTLPDSLSVEYDSHRPNWANDNEKPSTIKEKKEKYLSMVKCIDDNVGKILDTLDRLKMADDTIVIFTTDHGEFMGEHALLGKNRMYEPAFHIPFMIRWPNHIKQNVELDEFITTVDIKDTLLRLAGIEVNPNNSDGKDASGLFLKYGSNDRWDNIAYLHHATFEQTGIVTDDWFMAHVNNEDSVLFNRKDDPQQVNNLAYDDAYSSLMKQLTQELYNHHVSFNNNRVTIWLSKYL
jgi:uncharacterized sulfatase